MGDSPPDNGNFVLHRIKYFHMSFRVVNKMGVKGDGISLQSALKFTLGWMMYYYVSQRKLIATLVSPIGWNI